MRVAGRIGVVRRRRAHQLGVAALAIDVATFLAAPFIAGVDASVLFGLAVLATPALSLVATRIGASAHDSWSGVVELAEDGLSVRSAKSKRHVELASVEGALVRDLRWLEIRLRTGDVISIEVDEPARAHAFVRRLSDLGRARRAIRAKMPHLSWAPLSAAAGMYLAVATIVTSLAFSRLGLMNPFTRVLGFASAVIATWWLVHAIASPSLIVARDGVTIGRAFSSEFIPWTAIERTELLAGNLHLRLRDQRMIEVSSDRRTPMQTVTLIDRALRRARGASSDASTAVLERDGRPIEIWRAALMQLTDDESDAAYRGVHLPRATLEDVLDDPGAPAERRIGAALALRSLDPTYTTRVRVAAESCANELLRLALEKVADDAVDVAAVEDAARAEQA